MNRQYLKKGTELELNGDIFKIVGRIGTNGYSVVYEVEKKGNECTYKYYLKESYPLNAKVIRNDDGFLIWADEKERKRSLDDFEDVYKNLLKIQNNDKFKNLTSKPSNIYETMGTKYFLIDISAGENFATNKPEKLSDILTMVIALSKLIRKYHNAGYLHLDIKPENIFVIEKIHELPVLFDGDSVISNNTLVNEEIKSFSVSLDYSAPELIKGNIYEIDEYRGEKTKIINERTDIYSIGATLFYKIMGRYVRALDRGIFADWDFDNNYFFWKINPKVKKYVKDIFYKTLAVQNQDRYNNITELIETLNVAKKVCDEEIYLESNCPDPVKDFVGREEEIREIHYKLNENGTVFLSGMEGIGKSELAKKYAKEHEKDYDAIIFYRYNQSMDTLYKNIAIKNYTPDMGNKEKSLKSVLTENVLLIIDKFDVSKDKDLKELMNECKLLSKYNCKKLITTSIDFSGQKDIPSIYVTELNNSELIKLFENNYPHELTEEDSAALNNILRMVGDLTLCIPILAQQCDSSNITVTDLEEKLSVGLIELDKMKRINVNQEDKIVNDVTVPKFLKVVFNLINLKTKEKKVLRNLSLLNFIYVDKEEYDKIALYGVDQSKYITAHNTINKLVKKNLIKKSIVGKETFYELHPLIDELVRYELKCNYKNCKEVFSYVENHSKMVHIPSELPEKMRFAGDESVLSDFINEEKLKFVEAFINNLDEPDCGFGENTSNSLKTIISNSMGKEVKEIITKSKFKRIKAIKKEYAQKQSCVVKPKEKVLNKEQRIEFFLIGILEMEDVIEGFDEWFEKFITKIQNLFCFEIYSENNAIRVEFYDNNTDNEVSIDDVIIDYLENFIKKIPDEFADNFYFYGMDNLIAHIITDLCMIIEMKRETDNCIESMRKVFEYYFEKREWKQKLCDSKVLGYACAELTCGNDGEFNKYMEIIIDNVKKDIKGVDFNNLSNSNHPLIYYFEIQEIEEMLKIIFSYNPQKIKLIFTFYHKLIHFFEDYLSEISNYKEIMCICCAMICYRISIYKLKPEKDTNDLSYKKILDECQQKLNKLIEAKRFK